MNITRSRYIFMRFTKVNRKTRSWVCANIILAYDLFNEWRIFCWNHPKVKSKYRSANLFLLNKKLRYAMVDEPISGIDMDNLEDYYYGY